MTGKPLEFAAGCEEYKKLLDAYIKAGFYITAEIEPAVEQLSEAEDISFFRLNRR